jgi:hypothetical protein
MTKQRKTIITAIIIAVILAAGVFVWVNAQKDDKRVETTSTSPTAQSDYSDGDDRPSSSGGSGSQGGAIDTNGADVPTDTTGGVASESGVLTVLQPTENQELASGATLSGSAKDLSKVQYRLIDNDRGVIAQGALFVKDGVFSGKLQFEASATSGRLDVFSYDAQGEEINTIEMPVTFKK